MTEKKRRTLVWLIIFGGPVVLILFLVHYFVLYRLLNDYPVISVMEDTATRFLGGAGTPALGFVIHLVIAWLIAAAFYLTVANLALLRSNLPLGGLLYGIVLFFVMTFVVLPPGTAPSPDSTQPLFIVEGVLSTVIFIGMPLAMLSRKNIVLA